MNKLHVAILPSSGMGHVIPILELAKRLVTLHDCHVSFFILSTEASTFQSQLLRSMNIPDALQFLELPPVNLSTEDTHVLTSISVTIRESLPNIESVLANSAQPTVLVTDFFSSDAFEIASKLSIPKYIFFTSSASLLAFMMYLPTLDREIKGEFVDLPEPVRVPGCNSIKLDDLVEPVQNRKLKGYKWFLHHASRFPMADGILVNTWEDFEPVSVKALREDPMLSQIPTPHVYPVGPLVRSDKQVVKSESELMTWLDMQPSDSVLFVSFGSGGTLSVKQVTELAFGLELSRQRFIWVVRRPNDADVSGTYMNVGSDDHRDPCDYLPDEFLSRISGVGLVVPTWAPQTDILGHVSTGGFLSHCGWNSTLESIVHGVPMIAWPLYAEQKMNAAMLTEELGMSVRLTVDKEKGVVWREEIERAVRLVMEDEEGKALRDRVKEIKESGMRALDEGGSSYNSLSQVVKEWKCSMEDKLIGHTDQEDEPNL